MKLVPRLRRLAMIIGKVEGTRGAVPKILVLDDEANIREVVERFRPRRDGRSLVSAAEAERVWIKAVVREHRGRGGLEA